MRSPDQYISSGILELYVAGVLAPAEMEEVHAMAEKHETVAEEIKRIEAAHMKYAATHAPELSSGFFNRLTLKIEELPVVENQVQESPKTKPQPVRNIDKVIAGEPKTVKLQQFEPQREQRRSPARFYFVIAASLMLLVLSALLNFYLYNQWQAAQNDLVALQSENAALADEHDQLKVKYEEAYNQLAPYNLPDVKKVALKGQSISPQAEAMVYWNPKSQDVYLQILSLPAAPEGKQYQLWAIDENDKPVDAGMLTSLENSTISPMKKITSAKAFAI
ncbi:MAG: anti-sigma factor domain-containing protein, partial [Bacteroidia bacterium]